MSLTGKSVVAIARYGSIDIEFLRRGRYANLTQMADATGKRVDNWVRLKSTKDLITEFDRSPVYGGAPALKAKRGRGLLNTSDLSDLTLADIMSGNIPPGTWAHPDIAIQFAQWASPAFALWASRQIRTLLEHGEVALHRTEWTEESRAKGRTLNEQDAAELRDFDRFHGRFD